MIMGTDKFFEVTKRILVQMASTTSWGLHPEKGWSRPLVIQYNGEWYILANPGEDKYFEEQYFDYSEDVKNGEYVPYGMKVGEEKTTYSNEGCIPSRDYILKNFKIEEDDTTKR